MSGNIETIIVGGGQASLATSYYLAQRSLGLVYPRDPQLVGPHARS